MFNSNTKFLGLVLFLIGFASVPGQTVFGAELKYAKILDVRNREVLVQFGGLENSNNYLCNTFSLSCRNLGQATPQEISSFFNDKDAPLTEKLVVSISTEARRPASPYHFIVSFSPITSQPLSAKAPSELTFCLT
jgi:hypothetical protein